MIELIKQFDEYIFLLINGLHNPLFDATFWQISGLYFWLPVYIALIFIIIRKFKKSSIIILLFIALTIVFTDQISGLIKDSVQRIRPSQRSDWTDIVHVINNYRGGQFGFVSSHAANFFGLATFLSFLFKARWVCVISFICAIIVSYSRIYLGVHYPTDILGGAVLGVVIGYSCFVVSNLLIVKIISKS